MIADSRTKDNRTIEKDRDALLARIVELEENVKAIGDSMAEHIHELAMLAHRVEVMRAKPGDPLSAFIDKNKS